MPSVAIVSMAAFSASAVLPSLHIFVISSTFIRAAWLASSARTPTSALILASHLSQSPIDCCASPGAESHARQIRVKITVIVRVMSSPPPCVRSIGVGLGSRPTVHRHGLAVEQTTALVVSTYRGGATVRLERGRGRSAFLRETERADVEDGECGADGAVGAGLRRRDGDRRSDGNGGERLFPPRRDVDVLDVLGRVVTDLGRDDCDERHQGACRAAPPGGLPSRRETSEA